MKNRRKIVCPTYEKPIKLNAEGDIVLWASRMLQRHGSKIQDTERFHIGMRSAVISFQKKNNLKPTGTIDKRTWDKLNK